MPIFIDRGAPIYDFVRFHGLGFCDRSGAQEGDKQTGLGNATGFTLYEYSTSGKWLELLKQIAPGVMRAAVIRDPAEPSMTGQFAAIQSGASSLGVEVIPVIVRDATEIERGIIPFAHSSNVGLVVVVGSSTTKHRELIITNAARYELPAVYPIATSSLTAA